MYTLGISAFAHDAACALIKDNKICSLIEEERLNREKHTWKFPEKALFKCLELEGISIDDVQHIAFFWRPGLEFTGNIGHMLRFFPRSLNLFMQRSGSDDLSFFERVQAMRTVGKKMQRTLSLPKRPTVHFIEHHLCHASSAFYCSPFADAAVLCIDGRGESTSTSIWDASRAGIKSVLKIKVPHSLGHLYAAMTDYLGFKPFHDEWKVMGLSAYGDTSLVESMRKIIHLHDSGYELDLSYFKYHTHGQSQWLSEKFFETFGPKRLPTDGYEPRHYNIALALQRLVEAAGVHLTSLTRKKVSSENICFAGGVVLNCLMNRQIILQSTFKNYFFQPVANDAGASLGAALTCTYKAKPDLPHVNFDNVYFGPSFSNDEIEAALKEKGCHYQRSENICRDTAKSIAENKIVGWFQGRMEAGPRALGNRSITVSPMSSAMKDKLNSRVKKREFFRPFAPSIPEERVAEYFAMPKENLSPYMILVGEVKPDKRDKIPAVTHADQTARVQTVSKKNNPRYWQLLEEFGKITGVPVLVNTSFNENEPIVCTPQHAIDCFLRTDFDILAIGDFLVTKTPLNKNAAPANGLV